MSQLIGLKTTLSVTGGTTYTVQRGDTLSAIARKYNTTVSQLVTLNGIKMLMPLGLDKSYSYLNLQRQKSIQFAQVIHSTESPFDLIRQSLD